MSEVYDEKYEKVKAKLLDYISAATKNEPDMSIYEFVQALSSSHIHYLFANEDYEMYYGSNLANIALSIIGEWIDEHPQAFRDVLPNPFPTDEQDITQEMRDEYGDEIDDMFYALNEFGEDLQEICNITYKNFRR